MHNLNELTVLIEQEIKKLSFPDKPEELYKPIAYALESGGKRIRPALVLASYNMFADDVKSALPTALAFEVFHNFTLLHDDIMDNSDKRRNQPTVQKKWGVNRAILSGDAMMIVAYRLLAQSPAPILKSVLDLFNYTAIEVCEGQQYDLNFETTDTVSSADYLKMIRLKTAVLLAAGLKAGALLAQADSKDAELLYAFGTDLGIAFQLQDDVLDLYADEEQLGKPIGGDIIEGKKTILFIEFTKAANSEDKNSLLNLFGDRQTERKEKIILAKTLYNKYQTAEIVQKQIEDSYNNAFDALKQVNVPEERKKVLYDFAKKIMNRKK